MKIAIALGAEASALLAELAAATGQAIASLLPLPAGGDLFTFAPTGNPFGGEMTVTIAPAPALTAWAAKLKAKLTAFSEESSR